MDILKLNEYIRGWIVGDFKPSLIKTDNIEVAIKEYKSGDIELAHYHELSDEYTIVVSGLIQMNNELFIKGDIIKINKNEIANFKCIEDAITVVLKTISVPTDKYIVEEYK